MFFYSNLFVILYFIVLSAFSVLSRLKLLNTSLTQFSMASLKRKLKITWWGTTNRNKARLKRKLKITWWGATNRNKARLKRKLKITWWGATNRNKARLKSVVKLGNFKSMSSKSLFYLISIYRFGGCPNNIYASWSL